MQPTRPISKTLIDNISINSIEYPSYCGKVQISEHLIQFVILESFFKELDPKNINLYEHNFKKEYKLKLVNNGILARMKKRDKLLSKYCTTIDKESESSHGIYDEYNEIRNEVTKMKRDNKVEYYKNISL